MSNGINTHMHAGKTINSPSEPLNEANHLTVDFRGTIEASSVNQDLAIMETLNGSKDSNR